MGLDRRSLLRKASRIPRDPRLLPVETRLLSWNLNALATLYATDKARHLHNYTTRYEAHLRDHRRRVKRVLELGIGGFSGPRSGGASLRMWRDWFPRAEIFGLDIEPKEIDETRVTTILGDQSDGPGLREIGDRYGPFDLVVDDGSHMNPHVLCSFDALWDAVVPGGWYVIEDIATSYYPDMGGGPPGTENTSMALVKALSDAAHRGELTPEQTQGMRPELVQSVHVYPNIVFVEKVLSLRQGYHV